MIKKIIIISIVLILAIIAGVFWFAQNEVKDLEVSTIAVEPPTQIKTVSDENKEIAQNEEAEINISNWKTYTNEKYGFSVRYPKNWSVNDESGPYQSDFHVSFSSEINTKISYTVQVFTQKGEEAVKKMMNVQGLDDKPELPSKIIDTKINNLTTKIIFMKEHKIFDLNYFDTAIIAGQYHLKNTSYDSHKEESYGYAEGFLKSFRLLNN